MLRAAPFLFFRFSKATHFISGNFVVVRRPSIQIYLAPNRMLDQQADAGPVLEPPQTAGERKAIAQNVSQPFACSGSGALTPIYHCCCRCCGLFLPHRQVLELTHHRHHGSMNQHVQMQNTRRVNDLALRTQTPCSRATSLGELDWAACQGPSSARRKGEGENNICLYCLFGLAARKEHVVGKEPLREVVVPYGKEHVGQHLARCNLPVLVV